MKLEQKDEGGESTYGNETGGSSESTYNRRHCNHLGRLYGQERGMPSKLP